MIVLNLEPDDFSSKAIKQIEKYFKYKTINDIKSLNKKKVIAIIVKLKFRIDKKIINQFKNLQYIICNTTGIDHIDEKFCKDRNIIIISLKDDKFFMKRINSTAEYTFGLMISLVRKIPFAFNDVLKFKWRRNNFVGRDLFNMSIGIIGFGRNGKKISKYAKAFGMKVFYYDKNKNIHNGIKRVYELKNLLKNADIIIITSSLNASSYKLINEKTFGFFKKNSYLINTSRGEIICESSLIKALKKKIISGAALDVVTNEQKLNKHNLLLKYAKKNSNLIITPHIGGANYNAWDLTQNRVVEKFLKSFKQNLKKVPNNTSLN